MAFANKKFVLILWILLISVGFEFRNICAANSVKQNFFQESKGICSTESNNDVSSHFQEKKHVKDTTELTQVQVDKKTKNENVFDMLKVVLEKVKDEVAKGESDRIPSNDVKLSTVTSHIKVKLKEPPIAPTPTLERSLKLKEAESSGDSKDVNKDESTIDKDVYQTFNSKVVIPSDGKEEGKDFMVRNNNNNDEEFKAKDNSDSGDIKMDEHLHTKRKSAVKSQKEIKDPNKKPETKISTQHSNQKDPIQIGTASQQAISLIEASSIYGKQVPQNASALGFTEAVIEGKPPPPAGEREHRDLEEEEEEEDSTVTEDVGQAKAEGDQDVQNKTEAVGGDQDGPPTTEPEEGDPGVHNKTEPATALAEDQEATSAEVDVNASSVITPQEVLDDGEKEKDQLETYSQFAERVTAEQKNGVSGSNGHASNGQTKGPKVKSKNYASTDCGAKFLAANPESSHSHKIINYNKDEYMLNKCTGKIWAIVELCESIQPQKFDIANFELFSNSPKDVFLFGSHRYPTREWTPLGAFEGEEGNRDVQSFAVDTQEFFKYIKLEVHSYFGTEFFCPLSLFRIYGLSEFEVIEETEDNEEEQIIEEETFEEATESIKEKHGMIPDVIKSIMSGMLEVIKRGSRTGNRTNEPELNSFTQSCQSLREDFSIKKESCSFAESLNYILACYYDEYLKLVVNPFIAAVVQNTAFCQQLATIICASPQNNDSYVYDSVCNNSYACIMLSPKHILAMCHMQDPTILNNSLGCGPNDSGPPENASTTDAINTRLEVKMLDENATNVLPMSEEETSGDSAVVPHSSVVAPDHPSAAPKQDEGEVIHLPHIDTKLKAPKDAAKKGKESDPASEKASNTTLEPSDKPTSPNQEKKKEPKADKALVDKTTLGDDPSPPSPTSTVPPPSTAGPPSPEGRATAPTNKESVVVRLSNKIKVLEHNMSISSQYLEELSRRYKRQMEDMQRQFNITIKALNSTSVTAYERDLYHQKRLESLEGQLEQLAQIVSTLVQEKENLLTSVIEQHLILLFIEVVVMFVVFTVCVRRHRNELMQMTLELGSRGLVGTAGKAERDEALSLHPEGDHQGRETPSLSRRRSVDSIQMETETKPKQRRLSGQVAMSGTYTDLLITETTTKERRKKKKKGHLKRSLSNASISDKARSSSAPSKKEKKLEKLKRSSAGVLFSGENGSEEKPRFTRHHSMIESVGDRKRVEEIGDDCWLLVRKSRSKTKSQKSLPYTSEYPEVLASDLNRGKITIDEELPCNIYQQQYYTDIPFDQAYTIYDRDYLDNGYDKGETRVDYELDLNPTCDAFRDVYSPELDYSAPVINDYYHSVGQRVFSPKNGGSLKGGPHEDIVDATFLAPPKLPKSLTKTSALSEFRAPPIPPPFKGKTKLRSDNWEWYSSQTPRLPIVSSTEVVSNSSSDSSVRSKQVKLETKENDARKMEKRKKKKNKGLKLFNGEKG